MTTLLILYPWPDDPVAFRDYYERVHLPLCRQIPGVIEMRYSFEPQTVQGEGRWFCTFEMKCADAASLQAALATDESLRASDDVQNYSKVPPFAMIIEGKILSQ